jgi:hypothetical protein
MILSIFSTLKNWRLGLRMQQFTYVHR